ncbi:hypothetical protein FBU59_002662 [Linderina macrospora]|uniref:Uncharacterized protein n=1 Tax=Linderina macrospora TaxID=4868 RepID=A0ACC1JAU3_9FUNG|nr:hypothetical protein FBU59_002662 [Linderina macrospora]
MTPEEKERLMTPNPPIEAPSLHPSLQLASLTRREENAVMELKRQHSYNRCADAMRFFSECSAKYTIGVLWNCKEHKEIMNGCLRRANTADGMDRARAIFISEKQAKLDEIKDKPRTLI